MPTRDEIFKRDILRRVKRAHFYRTYLRPVTFEISALAALIGISAFFISLSHVFANAYNEPTFSAFLNFSVYAFTHTELSVKVLAVAVAMVGVLVVKDATIGLGRVTRRIWSII